MTATKTERLEFPIYIIEHDNGDGRLVKSLSFVQPATIERVLDENTGLVLADIMDGGLKGTITAPIGTRTYVTDIGETMLLVGLTPLTAKEAYDCARSSHGSVSCGLGFKPA